jgi:hypothetical protein
MTKEIKLKNGLTVLVDDEDYPILSQWNWCCVSNNKKYVKTNFSENGKQKPVYMHRFIMQAPKGMDVDHINGNPLDNRKENLRVCTHSENKRNTKKFKNNTTGYKGVSIKKDKFQVKISHDYKQVHIGLFNTVEEAVKAYNEAALKYHGEFARLNEL